MRLLVLLVLVSTTLAAIFDHSFTAAQERHEKKVVLTRYCTNICLDKCIAPKKVNGTLTCAVPPCPELPCDSGCIKRCIFAEKFLPHWLP